MDGIHVVADLTVYLEKRLGFPLLGISTNRDVFTFLPPWEQLQSASTSLTYVAIGKEYTGNREYEHMYFLPVCMFCTAVLLLCCSADRYGGNFELQGNMLPSQRLAEFFLVRSWQVSYGPGM